MDAKIRELINATYARMREARDVQERIRDGELVKITAVRDENGLATWKIRRILKDNKVKTTKYRNKLYISIHDVEKLGLRVPEYE